MTTPSHTPPFRVALVGCGRIAAKHLDALAALPECFSLCAVVEPEVERFQGDRGVGRFASLEVLLAHEVPELVVICSPSGEHAAQAERALLAGAHVLCEKPIGMSLPEVDALIDLAKKQDRLLIPCHQTRVLPSFVALLDAVSSGELGALHTVNMTLQWSRPQRYFDEESWRGSLQSDGGVLLNQASHLLDWMLSVIDAGAEMSEIFAWERVLRREVEAPDHVVMCWRGPRAQGTLQATVLAEPRNFEAALTVMGDAGTIQLGGMHGRLITRWEVPDAPRDADEIMRINELTSAHLLSGHKPLYEAVASWLSGERRERLEPFLRGARDVAQCVDLVRTSSMESRPMAWKKQGS